MTLREWDQTVAPVLHDIEDHSRIVASRANDLPVRPAFDTKAAEQLARAEQILTDALANIQNARKSYYATKSELA